MRSVAVLLLVALLTGACAGTFSESTRETTSTQGSERSSPDEWSWSRFAAPVVGTLLVVGTIMALAARNGASVDFGDIPCGVHESCE